MVISLKNGILRILHQFQKKRRSFILKKIGYSLALKKDSRKTWRWVKKNAKINNQSFMVSPPIKN
jgi:hypothetical protein